MDLLLVVDLTALALGSLVLASSVIWRFFRPFVNLSEEVKA